MPKPIVMTNMHADEKLPVINCHTHIFIGAHVPPYLAKTYLFWPFYKLITIPFILGICRFWFLNPYSPKRWKDNFFIKKIIRAFYGYRSWIRRHTITDWFVTILNFVIVYHAIIYFGQWLNHFFIPPNESTGGMIEKISRWLEERNLLFNPSQTWIKLFIFLFTIIGIRYGRRLIIFLLKSMWRFLSFLPDQKTIDFMARYVNIGRFAYYKDQFHILYKLERQYDEGTGFVLLPMDMEFMAAGKLKHEGRYQHQMEELFKIKCNEKHHVYPFVFVDPRRREVGNKVFFTWKEDQGNVRLLDCFIKEYIEEKNFSGFKIYPALGYYPFDERLLPLWKYAADHSIPVLTHAIRGTIYYRGRKLKEWGYHPVFKEIMGKDELSPLLLPELKNEDFINNFTHPLNYLCLVEERLLRLVVRDASVEIQNLFGYNGEDIPLRHNLRNLKLCFGHFGGEDEWKKYFESDRDVYSSQLKTMPDRGIDFVKEGEPVSDAFPRLEQIWKQVDWYSIISSMILQYDHLYADISYIIHDEAIIPLLKQTLQNKELRSRVLLGTDFYVVRNYKSEKELMAEIKAVLEEEDFDVIARENPRQFLSTV